MAQQMDPLLLTKLYLWMVNRSYNQQYSGLSTGTYQVTISNSYLHVPHTIGLPLHNPQSWHSRLLRYRCKDVNSNDGTATANPAGRNISLIPTIGLIRATTQTISNLDSGLYSATITDSHGCTTTGSYSVNVQGCTISAIADVTDAACYGSNNAICDIKPF